MSEKQKKDFFKKNPASTSGAVDFVERPLPDSETEIKNFREQARLEKRSSEIEEDLLEIYEDLDGNIVDVKKINIKKKRGFFTKLFNTIVVLALVGGSLYGSYYYYKTHQSRDKILDLSIKAPAEIGAGEEFFYTVEIHNTTDNIIKNIDLGAVFPDNFIFSESSPTPSLNQNDWRVDRLGPYGSQTVKIKGKIINHPDSDNLLSLRVTYYLSDFSTEFKKELAHSIKINGVGFDINADYSNTVLVGDDNGVSLRFSNRRNAWLSEFYLTLSLPENVVLATSTAAASSSKNLVLEKTNKDNEFKITGWDAGLDEQDLSFYYRVKEKREDKTILNLHLEAPSKDGQTLPFWEKELDLDVIKSDLSLILSVNDNKNDQAVNFDDSLNYVLSYSNKGDRSMKDLIIMAVVDGDFVDWNTLKDKNGGLRKKNTITWTKNEIPSLSELRAGDEGEIKFSLAVAPYQGLDLSKNFKITSYTQYNIGNSEEFKENSDNRSNQVVNLINSNLFFSEEFRYFDADNVPVGAGSLPPKVGQKTTLKVYWHLKNDLHELGDVRAEYILPEGVVYENNVRTSAGSVDYDPAERKISWTISRLPITATEASAEFGVSITPSSNDVDKIMVLSAGNQLKALDSETKAIISKQVKAQTTKLEDDDIAALNNDGRVQP